VEAVIPSRPNLVAEPSPKAKKKNREENDETQDAVVKYQEKPAANGVEAANENNRRESEQLSAPLLGKFTENESS
jgi:hypothetical protein